MGNRFRRLVLKRHQAGQIGISLVHVGLDADRLGVFEGSLGEKFVGQRGVALEVRLIRQRVAPVVESLVLAASGKILTSTSV